MASVDLIAVFYLSLELAGLVGEKAPSRGAAPDFPPIWVGCSQTSKNVVMGMSILLSAQHRDYF